jgi:hypothetical protein
LNSSESKGRQYIPVYTVECPVEMKISGKPAQRDKIGYKPEDKRRSRAKKSPKTEVYGVSTRYIPNTNTVAAKGIAIPPPKQGMPDHPFHPSRGSCLHGLGSCRVGCFERRGESFSWNIFHGSNVRDVGRREYGQRLWYVPHPSPNNPLVMVEPPFPWSQRRPGRT